MRIFLLRLVFVFTCLSAMGADIEPPSTAPILGNMRCFEDVMLAADSADYQGLEGVWYYPDDEITLLITRDTDNSLPAKFKYSLILLASADKSVEPGSVMGYALDSADPLHFDIWIYSDVNSSGQLTKPRRCLATLSADNSHITFKPRKNNIKLRISPSRFLPKFFRGISISINPGEEKSQLPGFRRLQRKGSAANPSEIYL